MLRQGGGSKRREEQMDVAKPEKKKPQMDV